MREIEVLFRSPGLSMTTQAVLLEAHRAIAALQDGQLSAMDEALERGEQRCRQLDAELQWQFARWRALATIHVGRRTEGLEALQALQQRVCPNSAFAPELFCIYDDCVVFGAPTRQSRPAILQGLASHPDDPPNLWALKVRTLVSANCLREARSLLHTVPAEQLALLPCDRDYLGTLGALTRAALGLEAHEYLEALVPLLSRYTEQFAVNISFWCEGSIAQLLGLALWQLGKSSEAIGWLEQAVTSSERAGLQACAAEARLDLALRRSKLE
jgi:tetratricopeptide (TPR) repeat protein